MRILVIEDDAGIAAGLRTTLQQRGYAVDVCGDVASAWSALRTERFDAVLLDLGLPDADGSVLLQRLRSAPATVGASGAALPNPATPVLIVTARDQVQQRIAGLDMGADDYVAKPFSARELLARLRAVLADPARRLSVNLKPFFDYGRAWNSGEDAAVITSLGVAGRLRWYGLTFDLSVAKRLHHSGTVISNGSNLQEQGIELQLSYDFF